MQAVETLWSELGQRLRRFVAARVNDAHAAEDIAQDVMLKLHTQLDTIEDGDSLPAWVFAVARNAIVDHYRARAVRDHADVGADEPSVDFSAAERRDALRELAPCLARMVEHLPEPYREAMKLVDFDGMSQQELADRAGVSLSGAKSRVQRARVLLRDMLHDCCRIERDARGNPMEFDTTERSARYCGDDDGTPQCGR